MVTKEDMPMYKAAKVLWKMFPPIFLVVGIFGNIISIIILTNKRSRNSSTSLFLAALALADILALFTGLTRWWVKHVFDFDVRNDVSVFGCRLHWFVVYLVTQFSSWMLICVTVERVVSTSLPHMRAVICRVKIAKVSLLVIFATLFVLNLHYFYGYGNITVQRGNVTYIKKCVPATPGYSHFISYQWGWIDLCVFYLIPVFVLLVGNSAVIYKVVRSKRRSRREINPTATSVTATNASASIGPTTTPKPQKTDSKKISSLTIILILVSSVFIICITPIVVFPIGEPYWLDGADTEKLAELYFWHCFSNLIMYVNHTANFFLYFLSASKFRNDFKNLFCRKKNMRINNTTQNSRTPVIPVSG